MKLEKLTCPNCNATLDIKINSGQDSIFCLYCGQGFLVDDGKKEITINKNTKSQVNINKNIHINNRITNDAEVLKARAKVYNQTYPFVVFFTLIVLMLGLFCFLNLEIKKEELEKEQAISEGKIHAGSSKDYIDKKYDAVVEQLEELGFSNIATVDLKDAGIALWKNKKVESVSIDGDTSFFSSDFFDKDAKIVVSYH